MRVRLEATLRRWRESHDAPPLPPRAAVPTARAFLHRMCGDTADDWELHAVALQPVAGTRDAWVYLVELVKPPRLGKDAVVGSVFPATVTVLVLLDGTITPAQHPLSPRR